MRLAAEPVEYLGLEEAVLTAPAREAVGGEEAGLGEPLNGLQVYPEHVGDLGRRHDLGVVARVAGHLLGSRSAVGVPPVSHATLTVHDAIVTRLEWGINQFLPRQATINPR